MAKTKSKPTKESLSKLQAHERKQGKLLHMYRQQRAWITGGAIAILILILLLTLTLGYATNWWQDPSKTALQRFPTTAAGQETVPTASSGSSGDTGGGSGTNKTQTTTSGQGANTTNNTTTTTKETTTNNTTTTTPSTLQQFYDSLGVGKSIDDAKALANSLGISTSCHTEILVVQVCDFTAGGQTISTKNLMSNGLITGIIGTP